MGWLARLFGREHGMASLETTSAAQGGNTPLGFSNGAYTGANVAGDGASGTLQRSVESALVPLATEVQRLGQRLDELNAWLRGNGSPMSTARSDDAAGLKNMESAIEYALAHFYSLLRRRGEEFTVPAAMLGQTPDGNTILPFDPREQYLLLIMNPLYPHLYATLMVLPKTYTRVDTLSRLPNNVQTHALHIDTRKAPPGFIDALWALYTNNSANLYLGKMEPSADGVSPHTLKYFPCTGSEPRNPKPQAFPNEIMLYFHAQPQPIIVRQDASNADEVFAALRAIEHDRQAEPPQSLPQGDTNIH